MLTGESGETPIQLKPIEGDWLNPDVFNPHRLRVLFETKPETRLRSNGLGAPSSPAATSTR